jgi:SPP1 gp7 family putative phage head morphogenesis protein
MIKNMKPLFNAMTDNNLDSLVKTSVATVVNDVRMQTYRENESIFKGYEHLSTLDKSTTYNCANRDGATYDLDFQGTNIKGKEFPFKKAPLHYRCRSVILPITKSYRELGLDIDEIPKGTRASMDGSVPETTTFTKWFEGKDKAFQEQYLGVGRYQLYKDGKITLSQLVNQQGATIPIKDLNKLSEAPIKNKPQFNKESLTTDEKFLIKKKWCGSQYGDIRRAYYENTDNASKNEMNDLFNKYEGDYNGEIYRGLSFFKKNEKRVEMFKQFENLNIGDSFTDNAPMSFSKDTNVAKKFGELADNNIHSVIIVLRNYKTKAYDISNLSWSEWEQEVLVKNGTKYKVVDKKSKDGNILLALEEE